MSSGYTKLFASILASTIWRAPDRVRIVWITMLAMADKHGIVEASVPGLADFARVPVGACRKALEALSAPDPDSRSTDDDGRRISAVDGGWQLVNHLKYRDKMSADERRNYLRVKQAEHRQRRKQLSTSVNTVSDKSTESTHTEAEAEADTEAVRTKESSATRRVSESSLSTTFDAFWEAYPRKVGKDAALVVWRRLRPDHKLTTRILAAVQAQAPSWDDPKFIPHPRTWLYQGRWKDEPGAPPAPKADDRGHVPPCRSVTACRDRALRDVLAVKAEVS